MEGSCNKQGCYTKILDPSADSFEILAALQQIAQKNCKKKKGSKKKKPIKDKPTEDKKATECNDDKENSREPCQFHTFRIIPLDAIKSIEIVDSPDEVSDESSEW
jgi:hypothetical protein